MKTCFTTVVSSDHYQNYIPLYCLALRSWYKGDIIIFLRGSLSENCFNAIKDPSGITIITKSFLEYPNNISTTNCLRFVIGDIILSKYDFSLITDIDLLILQDPWQWHLQNASPAHPYSGYHGAINKPKRPNICKSWTGSFERVAGGFFCVTPEWFNATRSSRTKYGLALLDGRCGLYREQDEVMLSRIIKDSGFKVPPSKYYPRELRSLHLGDFKFDKRWQRMERMKRILTNQNIQLFLKLSKSKEWLDAVKTLQDPVLNTILSRVLTHIKTRIALG